MSKRYFNIQVKTPASIANLGSGYDCLAMALELWNFYDMKIDLNQFPEGDQNSYKIRVNENYYFDNRITSHHNNLFIQSFSSAIKKFCADKYDLQQKKFNIEVFQTNYIPHVRGLGSSSSASVAGVLAAIELARSFIYKLDIDIDDNDIVSLARDYDSCQDNVCASYAGGLTVVFSDEKVKRGSISRQGKLFFFKYPISDEDLRIVMLTPDKHLITLEAKAVLESVKLSVQEAVFNLTRAVSIPAIFRNRKYELLKEAMKDKIHQDVRSQLYSDRQDTDKSQMKPINIQGIFNELIEDENGAYGACISGAGSSLAAFTSPNMAEKIAEKFIFLFKKYSGGSGWNIDSVRILKPTNFGASSKSFISFDTKES